MEILPLPESRAFWDTERENNSDSFMFTYMIMYIEKIKLFKIHRIYLLCGNSPDPGSAATWLFFFFFSCYMAFDAHLPTLPLALQNASSPC